MFFFELFVIIFFGLVLGSFSTALIYRVPRKLPWGAERSACPNCNSVLGVFDLVPVISWCMSRGICRHCAHKIPARYPLLELTSVLLCLGIYYFFGFSIESLFIITAVPILISLFVVDWEFMILPNQLVFILMFIGVMRLIYLLMGGAFLNSNDVLINYGLAALIYGFVSWFIGFVLTKILNRNSLGFGDVKFFAVAGLWLGLNMLPYFMIMSGGLAILFAFAWRMFMKKEIFPFGPALIVTFYSLLLFQGSFIL